MPATASLAPRHSQDVADTNKASSRGEVVVACTDSAGHLDVTITPDDARPTATQTVTMQCPGSGGTYGKTVFKGALAAHHSVRVTNPTTHDVRFGVDVKGS